MLDVLYCIERITESRKPERASIGRENIESVASYAVRKPNADNRGPDIGHDGKPTREHQLRGGWWRRLGPQEREDLAPLELSR